MSGSIAMRGVGTLTVRGVYLDRFDTVTRAESTADNQKHRFGGELYEVDLGGPPTFGSWTFTRVWVNERDSQLFDIVEAALGIPLLASGSYMDLDNDQHPFGRPKPIIGTVIRNQAPAADSSSSDKRFWEIEVSRSGAPS
jgi:hypothetical protein